MANLALLPMAEFINPRVCLSVYLLNQLVSFSGLPRYLYCVTQG